MDGLQQGVVLVFSKAMALDRG